MSTGAWFSPVDDPGGAPVLCTAGNVNVLTPDVGSSGFSQGCAGARALVEVQRWEGDVPPVASAGAAARARRLTNAPASSQGPGAGAAGQRVRTQRRRPHQAASATGTAPIAAQANTAA